MILIFHDFELSFFDKKGLSPKLRKSLFAQMCDTITMAAAHLFDFMCAITLETSL